MSESNKSIEILEHVLSVKPLTEEDINRLSGIITEAGQDLFLGPGNPSDALFILRTRGIIGYDPKTKEYFLNKDYEFIGEIQRKGPER
jgi:hypothetical protein